MQNDAVNNPRRPPKNRALEDTFDTVVRQSGEEVVSDLLPSNAAQLPLNADYLLAGRTVIAELKCLQKDYFVDTPVGEKLQKLIDRWRHEGLIRAEHIVNGLLSFEHLPEEYRHKLNAQAVAVFARPLDQALKHANDQIKATRDYFGLPNAKGLLILANDGNFAMPPDFAVPILRNRLESRYSAIHSFIYFAPGMEVSVAGVKSAKRFWVDGAARDYASCVEQKIIEKLRSAWVGFNDCTEIVGEPGVIEKIGFARS